MSALRLRYFAYLSVCVVGAIILAFLFLRYLFMPILPFLIAWGVALALRPPSLFISKKIHLNKKIVAVTLAVLVVLLGLGAGIALVAWGVRELWSFLSDFASGNRLTDILSKISSPLGSIFGEDFAFSEHIGEVIRNAVSTVLTKLVDLLSVAVSGVPKILFFVLVTVISSIYFSLDLERINQTVISLLPKRLGEGIIKAKRRFFTVGVKYIKSYLIIMLITFAIMLLGFLILRVRNALFIAALVAVLDFFPVIGVGTIIVPWSIYQLISGNVYVGVGLVILLLIHEIIRQFAEPKIIGKNLGIHPIISLVLLYVGYSVFGILGLVFLPIIGAVAVLLNKNNSAKVT